MNNYKTSLFWCTIGLMFLLGTTNRAYAQNWENAYLNSSDPNTIEYDNIVVGVGNTMVRQSDGRVLAWGSGVLPGSCSIATPIEINGTFFGNGEHRLRGDVLRFAVAQTQFAVLTTEGLYVWGAVGDLVSKHIYDDPFRSFKKVSLGTYNVDNGAVKADGLPYGVKPEDVKMMFGAEGVLAVVTYDGQAWVLNRSPGFANPGGMGFYGDGALYTNINHTLWHRVCTAPDTPLENVVAVRGYGSSMMALTAEGEIYTWGFQTFLGNNTQSTGRYYATAMVKPIGITPKMIGSAYTFGPEPKVHYYLLGTNGRLYALGGNSGGQLGNGVKYSESRIWREVSATREVGGVTYLLGDNIAWISTSDRYETTALTVDGKLWRWGQNLSDVPNNIGVQLMYSTTPSGGITVNDPLTLNLDDRVLAVATGRGHTVIIKQCQARVGFYGQNYVGTMGNNLYEDRFLKEYSFMDTPEVNVPGAMSQLMLKDQKICVGTTFNLDDAVPRFLPSGTTRVNWWMDASGTIPVANPQVVGPGIYYATVEGPSSDCLMPTPTPMPMRVSYYTAADPEFKDCGSHFVTNPLVRQLMKKETDAVEKSDQFISR